MSRSGVLAAALLLGACAGFASDPSHAQAVAAATGCPQFHCTPEATGIMSQPIVGSASLASTITLSDASLGTLHAQGCSGNGKLLACLADPPPGTRGILKIIDTTTRPTLKVIHTDGSFASSKRLVASWNNGQVPFMFSDGRVGAGDARSYKIYDFTRAIPRMTSAALPWPAPQGATTLGLTDLSNGYGVVARTDGVLTFIKMARGTVVGSLSLAGQNGEPVILNSPPSASNGVLYAVAKGDAGYLFAVSMDGNAAPTTWNWRYANAGKISASPVDVSPSESGYSKTLVLLAVSDSDLGTPQLLGILDNGSSATVQWYIQLAQNLPVTPSVDGINRRVYFMYQNGHKVYEYPLYVGGSAPVANATGKSYDLQALAGMPDLHFNGHIGAIQSGLASDFTLLLAGTTSSSGPSSSQYMVAFRPNPAPGAAWATMVSAEAARATGAWNLSPSSTPGIYCPLLVEVGTGGGTGPGSLALMCDH